MESELLFYFLALRCAVLFYVVLHRIIVLCFSFYVFLCFPLFFFFFFFLNDVFPIVVHCNCVAFLCDAI